MAKMNVTITKGKGTIEVDTDTIPEAVYAEALLQGLKVLLNRGMSKITKETYPQAEEMKAAAMAKAAENLVAVNESKIRFTGGKPKQATGAIMTEARRLAKNVVKDEMKRQGIKISHVEASEITKAANALLDQDPSFVEQAKANIAERGKIQVAEGIIKGIQISQKLVAKADAKKAAGKGQLSAKQAGMVQSKAKGGTATA